MEDFEASVCIAASAAVVVVVFVIFKMLTIRPRSGPPFVACEILLRTADYTWPNVSSSTTEPLLK